MKINKAFILIVGLICTHVQPYFWQNWKKPETEQEIEKRKIDLKYQEKRAHLEHKKQDVTARAQQKGDEINYKRDKLELERKKDQLKIDREDD